MDVNTKMDLIFKIISALDDYEALDFNNVPMEEVKNIIENQLRDYVIIKGEVLR